MHKKYSAQKSFRRKCFSQFSTDFQLHCHKRFIKSTIKINKLGSRSLSSKFNSSSTKGSTFRVSSQGLLEPGACYYNCNATTTTHQLDWCVLVQSTVWYSTVQYSAVQYSTVSRLLFYHGNQVCKGSKGQKVKMS